jgi:5-methylcytosine-specific restriction endonuclease McrA
LIFEGYESEHAPAISGRVLILNQSYEPVTICSVQKAVILLFLHKADMVATADGRVIRSVRSQMPFPSVIRLSHYRRIPYRNIILSRKNILRRDGFRCQYCGAHSAQLTVDHVIPKSRGGSDSWENLVTACVRCNNSKDDRTPEAAGMNLHARPRRPSHVTFIIHSAGTVEENWKPFLFMRES